MASEGIKALSRPSRSRIERDEEDIAPAERDVPVWDDFDDFEIDDAEGPASAEQMRQPREPIYGAVGLALVRNGWSALPQVGYSAQANEQAERRPAACNGQGIRYKAEWRMDERLPPLSQVAVWERHCSQHNAACVLGPGNTFALDVDVTDPDLSDQIMEAAFRTMGKTPLVRYGRWPKVALIYRAASAEEMPRSSNHRLAALDGETERHAIEILGKGKLLTLIGLHHKTGNYFKWPDQNPVFSGPEAAPAVTSEMINAFLAEAAKIRAFASPADRISAAFEEGGDFDANFKPGVGPKIDDGRESLLFGIVGHVASALPAADRSVNNVAKFAVMEFTLRAELSGRWTPASLKEQAIEKARRTVADMASGALRPRRNPVLSEATFRAMSPTARLAPVQSLAPVQGAKPTFRPAFAPSAKAAAPAVPDQPKRPAFFNPFAAAGKGRTEPGAAAAPKPTAEPERGASPKQAPKIAAFQQPRLRRTTAPEDLAIRQPEQKEPKRDPPQKRATMDATKAGPFGGWGMGRSLR